jgi:hypothetical protein
MSIEDFTTWFYNNFAIPEQALIKARVYKKQLLENADLTITDRKWVNDDIETIDWRYSLKPATVAIPKFEDAEREYIEIALLHITLKSPTHVKRLAEVVQRTIPYPLVIVFAHEQALYISLADKRINRADSSKLTVEHFYESGWLNASLQAESQIHHAFFASFQFNQFDHQDLHRHYQSLIACFNALDAAKLIGKFTLAAGSQADKLLADKWRQEHLQAIKQLDSKLVSIKAAVKTDSQFNRKLALNVQIKQLKQQIEQLTLQLSA